MTHGKRSLEQSLNIGLRVVMEDRDRGSCRSHPTFLQVGAGLGPSLMDNFLDLLPVQYMRLHSALPHVWLQQVGPIPEQGCARFEARQVVARPGPAGLSLVSL